MQKKASVLTLTLLMFGILIAFLRWKGTSKAITVSASALVGGALASCLVFSALFPYLMDVIVFNSHQVTPPDEGSPLLIRPMMGLVWIVAAFVTFVFWCYRGGMTEILNALRQRRSGERGSVQGGLAATPRSKGPSSAPKYNTSSQNSNTLNPEAFNMFDPAELPPRLAEYANMVYSACEDLGNFFGFQDSSVRNEAEHLLILLSNHRRYMTVLPLAIQPPSPIHALHAKVSAEGECGV